MHSNIPYSVTILGQVNVDAYEEMYGKLTNLAESKMTRISLETLVLSNQNKKTGFLMWISSYCIVCIYQQNAKVSNCDRRLYSQISFML